MGPLAKVALLRDLEHGREALDRAVAAFADQARNGSAARARRARRELSAVMRLALDLRTDPEVPGTTAELRDRYALAEGDR